MGVPCRTRDWRTGVRRAGVWRRRAAGVTLIEVLVVMVIIALVSVAVIAGSGQLASARLKKAATMTAGAVRVAFNRATATSLSVRVVFDIDQHALWLEEASQPMLVETKDKTGTGGADPMTEAERKAVEEGESIFKGPRAPRPRFRPIQSLGFVDPESGKGLRSLGRGITWREVQTSHDDAPRTSGRAYLYFWPGGQTERASIQLRIGTSIDARQTLTLLVSPLTGKVTLADGPVALKLPETDKDASEREESGGVF